MSGHVIVINCFNELVESFNVSGNKAGEIPPWTIDQEHNIVFGQLAICRIVESDDHLPDRCKAAFYVGDNNLLIHWDSGAYKTMVTIPGPDEPPYVSIDDDLFLYVFKGTVLLTNHRGFLLYQGKVEHDR